MATSLKTMEELGEKASKLQIEFERKYLNPYQIAFEYGGGYAYLQKLRDEKRGPPFIRIDKQRFLYPAKEFNEWLAACDRKPAA
jgi:hypothetical protein